MTTAIPEEREQIDEVIDRLAATSPTNQYPSPSTPDIASLTRVRFATSCRSLSRSTLRGSFPRRSAARIRHTDRVDSHLVTSPTGYDPSFLLPTTVPIPTVKGLKPLPYKHFTVLTRPSRRLCAITAVNIDGSSLVDIGRSDDWRLDPRLPASEQAGPELYSNNDLDRGHLVRRRDPVWGNTATATQANLDTFRYTVCAPQTATFNQSKELWAGLEDYLLEHAETTDERLTVFTGPLFRDDDPIYRSVAIPRRFFKVGVWFTGASLAATGYILDQSASLDPIVRASEVEVPPLGQYRTFQVPISDIARLAGLPMDQLVDVDRYAPVAVADSPDAKRGWTELTATSDIVGVH